MTDSKFHLIGKSFKHSSVNTPALLSMRCFISNLTSSQLAIPLILTV